MPKITERSWVEIDLAAFRANLKALKSFMPKGQGFIQIVKADAYGHGALEITRIALEEGALALGVANAEEGKLLRIQGVQAPVLILSPSLLAEIETICEYQLTPTISDLPFAEALNDCALQRKLTQKAQLKLDSGMHRSGADQREFANLYNKIKALTNIELEGVFSHFAASESDLRYSLRQEALFHDILIKNQISAEQIHIANSSAVVNGLGNKGNLCRLGILSYGIYTEASQKERIDLKPVMTFKSTISQIKDIGKGEYVGYNLTWQAGRKTRYAIVPVGYADGYDFLLSNRGLVSVRGALCPVIGRVSMDMICIDVTNLKALKEGDEVILLGGSNPELRAESLAASYGGSAYEMLCQVGRRARRYYLENKRVLHRSPMSRRDFVSSDYSDSKLSQIIQSALSQRLRDEEIGELISREILRSFFYNKDQDIHYRHNFNHTVRFTESDSKTHYRTQTTLSFDKILQQDYFIVACANSDAALKTYFKRRDVEYRWLMDSGFDLNASAFALSAVRINDIELDTSLYRSHDCLEIRCSHPELKALVGTQVRFEIDTTTLYPKASHQLSIFITELTRGVRIAFEYPDSIPRVECVPVFSGQDKYPRILQSDHSITVSSRKGEWVFPLSGVVFAY